MIYRSCKLRITNRIEGFCKNLNESYIHYTNRTNDCISMKIIIHIQTSRIKPHLTHTKFVYKTKYTLNKCNFKKTLFNQL